VWDTKYKGHGGVWWGGGARRRLANPPAPLIAHGQNRGEGVGVGDIKDKGRGGGGGVGGGLEGGWHSPQLRSSLIGRTGGRVCGCGI
jgi:hypothetical protein